MNEKEGADKMIWRPEICDLWPLGEIKTKMNMDFR